MQSTLRLIGLVALLSGPVVAQAATIDLTTATNDGTTLTAADATITAGAGTTLVVGDFVANAVCPLGGSGCNGIMRLTFDFDVNNVNFDYGFGNPGDSAALSIFDGLGGSLGTLNLTLTSGTAFADLSGFGTLRSILFDNTAATGAGYAYGDINYERVGAVPEPATLLLLGTGLGLAAVRRRRKQRA